MNLITPAEHPFAHFVRILGKGKRGARDLTREEAYEAMGMLLDDKVEDTQLGAFLMLLRHKEESAEEMAGFAEAVRERLQVPRIAVDLDWPSYAGKKRHLPWYLLAVKALAAAGDSGQERWIALDFAEDFRPLYPNSGKSRDRHLP